MASGEEETHPENWSVERVVEFLKSLPDFSDFASIFKINDIDGAVLLKLTDQELKEDLKISSLGKRKKLLDEIKKLKRLSRRPRSTSNGLYSGTASNPRSEFHSSASTVSTEWSTSFATTTATSKPSVRTDFLDDSSIAEPPSMSGALGNHFATGNADNSNSLTSTPTIAPEAMTLPSEADSETLTPLLEKSTSFASAALTLVTEAKSSNDATLPMPSESKPSSSVLAEKTPSYSDITATSASTVTDGTTSVTTTSASAGTDGTTEEESVSVRTHGELVCITKELAKLSIKKQPRTYQDELLMKIDKARQNNHNVIVCGPTGSGKTLVAAKHCAAVLVKKWSESHEGKPEACIYFIVPTVHLVVKIECKQCGKDVCQASQVLLIDFHYVVPGEILDTKVRKERVTSKSKYGKVGKIFCNSCSADWGVLKQFGNGQETPALKCTSFIFVVAGHGKAIKKWKDVPFEVQEGTEDDLLLDSDV